MNCMGEEIICGIEKCFLYKWAVPESSGFIQNKYRFKDSIRTSQCNLILYGKGKTAVRKILHSVLKIDCGNLTNMEIKNFRFHRIFLYLEIYSFGDGRIRPVDKNTLLLLNNICISYNIKN